MTFGHPFPRFSGFKVADWRKQGERKKKAKFWGCEELREEAFFR